jgi:catechol 2,3-dioxygenase-like lactoylglutathione lyase family enzyme
MAVEPHLRIARATSDFRPVLRFYRDGLGLYVLGEFVDHEGFDGIMLGPKSGPYHFEFTAERGVPALRAPSRDNLLVFYLPEREDWVRAVGRMREAGFEPVRSHNPYWDEDGVTFEDADGYRVVLQNAAWAPGS